MPRSKRVGSSPALDEARTAPLVEPAGFAASVESLVVWANSMHLRRRLMDLTGFPLVDDTLSFLVLNQLIYRGAARPTDMAEAVQTSTSNIAKVVRRLEEAGLVVRGPDPDDRRALIVALSDEGRLAGERIAGELEQLFGAAFASWSATDRSEFERLTVRFAQDLDLTSEHEVRQVSGVNWMPRTSADG